MNLVQETLETRTSTDMEPAQVSGHGGGTEPWLWRDKSELQKMFGSASPPFYIYGPPLLGTSAGVRLLYQLAHMLNSVGEQAWIIPDGTAPSGLQHSLIYTAPLLTREVADLHFRQRMTPVVVYPEVVSGNPLNAPVVARWLLNTPGLLGGPLEFSQDESVFAYTSRIARSIVPSTRLFLPTTDIRELDAFQADPWEKRSKSAPVLVYAAKYKSFVGKPKIPAFAQDRLIISLERDGPRRQSRSALLQLLANAHCVIAYENTAVITEAVLLGTPVVLVRSPFFPALLADAEIGTAGTAWSTEDDPLTAALHTLRDAHRDYQRALTLTASDLQAFIELMRERTRRARYLAPLEFEARVDLPPATWRSRIAYARWLHKQQGSRAVAAATFDFVARRVGHGDRLS